MLIELVLQSAIPAIVQSLYCNGKLLAGPTETLLGLGVKEDDLLLLRRKESNEGPGSSASAFGQGTGGEQEVERLRQEMLGNPQLMAQLRAVSISKEIKERNEAFLTFALVFLIDSPRSSGSNHIKTTPICGNVTS